MFLSFSNFFILNVGVCGSYIYFIFSQERNPKPGQNSRASVSVGMSNHNIMCDFL